MGPLVEFDALGGVLIVAYFASIVAGAPEWVSILLFAAIFVELGRWQAGKAGRG